jgi:magnesium chelatase family protein
MDPEQSEDSATVRSRVMLARNRQAVRFRDTDIMTNAEMPGRDLETYCQMQESARRMLKRAGERLGLSARSYSRLLKVARTIADLEDDARVGEGHLSEAVRYRGRK